MATCIPRVDRLSTEPRVKCHSPNPAPYVRKGVINLKTINKLTYIILNNYLENINLQKI